MQGLGGKGHFSCHAWSLQVVAWLTAVPSFMANKRLPEAPRHVSAFVKQAVS